MICENSQGVAALLFSLFPPLPNLNFLERKSEPENMGRGKGGRMGGGEKGDLGENGERGGAEGRPYGHEEERERGVRFLAALNVP